MTAHERGEAQLPIASHFPGENGLDPKIVPQVKYFTQVKYFKSFISLELK